jgi:hypothetical protein
MPDKSATQVSGRIQCIRIRHFPHLHELSIVSLEVSNVVVLRGLLGIVQNVKHDACALERGLIAQRRPAKVEPGGSVSCTSWKLFQELFDFGPLHTELLDNAGDTSTFRGLDGGSNSGYAASHAL